MKLSKLLPQHIISTFTPQDAANSHAAFCKRMRLDSKLPRAERVRGSGSLRHAAARAIGGLAAMERVSLDAYDHDICQYLPAKTAASQPGFDVSPNNHYS